jgi:hypothetical protein
MYYAMTAEWPSLSIDVVRDNLGAVRTRVRHCVVDWVSASRGEDSKTDECWVCDSM